MPIPRLSHLALLAIAFAGNAQAQVVPCGAQVPDSAPPTVLEGRTTRDTVPGGIRVAILTRPSRCDSVVARVTVRFGDEITLADRVSAVRVLRKFVGLGTSAMTARAVRDSFARLGTTFTVAGSPSRMSILLHTAPTYLAPTLALTATLLRQPRFEPAAFDSIQADILTGLAEDSASVVDLASARLLQALSPYPPSHPTQADHFPSHHDGVRSRRDHQWLLGTAPQGAVARRRPGLEVAISSQDVGPCPTWWLHCWPRAHRQRIVGAFLERSPPEPPSICANRSGS